MPKRLQANPVHRFFGDPAKQGIAQFTKERVAQPRRSVCEHQQQHHLQGQLIGIGVEPVH